MLVTIYQDLLINKLNTTKCRKCRKTIHWNRHKIVTAEDDLNLKTIQDVCLYTYIVLQINKNIYNLNLIFSTFSYYTYRLSLLKRNKNILNQNGIYNIMFLLKLPDTGDTKILHTLNKFYKVTCSLHIIYMYILSMYLRHIIDTYSLCEFQFRCT